MEPQSGSPLPQPYRDLRNITSAGWADEQPFLLRGVLSEVFCWERTGGLLYATEVTTSSCCYCQPEAGQGSPFQVGSVAALYTAALVLVAFVGSHRLGITEEDAF